MKLSKLAARSVQGASALCLALLLQACGGGGGGGSASNQVADGVVNGFGSVFVNGVEIEDAKASVRRENYDGSFTNAVLQMGQRVRVEHNGKGTATKVTIDAAVLGKVSSIDTNANTLTVAGQKVNVVTATTAGSSLTVWGGGYSSFASVASGDVVEVHGTPVYNSTAKIYTVNASRIAKVTDSSGRMQVVGTISNLDTAAKTFAINGLTVKYSAALLRPANAALANGTVVTAYGLLTALSGTTLTASNLKVNRLQDTTLSISTAQIGGQVSKFDSVAKTFEVQGIKVTIGSSTTINPNGSAVADGAYVNVVGTVGVDGGLTATNIQVRQQNTDSDLATVKLIGVISDYVDNTSFVVRGVPVDASGINVAEKCPGVTLANDLQVEVTATQQADTPVVLATNLKCQVKAAIIIRPVDGTASNVDTAAKTFSLTVTGATTTQSVQWNSSTTFVGVTPAALAGSTVRVEGYLSGTSLIARTISKVNSTARLDDEAFRKNNGAGDSWSAYRASHRR